MSSRDVGSGSRKVELFKGDLAPPRPACVFCGLTYPLNTAVSDGPLCDDCAAAVDEGRIDGSTMPVARRSSSTRIVRTTPTQRTKTAKLNEKGASDRC